MRARIIKIHKTGSMLRYTYVDTPKWRDDVEAVRHYFFSPPMMSVRVFKEDDTLGEEILMYASPDIVESYTLIDFFKLIKEQIYNNSYTFSIEHHSLGYCWDIEFEMTRGEYPYLYSLVEVGHRDYLIAPIVDYPRILKINKTKNIW